MSSSDVVVDLKNEDGVAVITVDSPPVNALSARVRDGLDEAFKQADSGDAVAIVLICAGRTFIAGADISEFGGVMKGVNLRDLETRVEACSKPVVAAIHGTALGGGLELALCAHYRVAVPSARFGFPEVNLGLLPGAGGTQRLPRIVGVEAALDIVTSGKQVSATSALESGLINAICAEGELRSNAIAFARRVASDGGALVKVRDFKTKLEEARGKPEIFEAFRKANARKFRGFLAPEYNIRCIEAAVNAEDFDAGVAVEHKLFGELVAGPQSAAQRYYFFAERQAAKIPDVPEDTEVRPISRVGVIGAGTMGGGIAMNFVNVGVPVTLVETNEEALARGLGTIRKNYERSSARGGLTRAQVDERMALISGSVEMSELADCDLVIEAVFERMALKKEIFAKLDEVCKPGAILATNTSALDVNEIAAATKRPQDVVGLHFFSPANVMKLLEVVRGEKTSKDVIATSMKLAKKIGKIAVLAGVCPGFIGNRMLRRRQEEAFRLVMEGAMPWDIDRVLYGFGFPMGPFAMSDLAGLDIGWIKENSKGESLRDRLCEAGRFGQKTGAGYYDYDADRNAKPSPVTEAIIEELIAASGVNRRAISDEEILNRCIHPMINEGAKLLEERKAIRASDIDVVWVNGYGWPVYRGGPMHYADQIGPPAVLETMRRLAVRPELRPAALLEELAASGRTFAEFSSRATAL